MNFPCKNCISCCICKTMAHEYRDNADEFCGLTFRKCTTIVSHLKYKRCEFKAPVIKFKPIQFNVFLKFFGYQERKKPMKDIYYLPKRMYKTQSPCILIV